MRRLQDRVAVVTGAVGGIGRALALELARAGAHVVLADVDEHGMVSLAREIEALGRRCSAIATDVRHLDQVERLLCRTLSAHGACHIMINNAGVLHAAPLLGQQPCVGGVRGALPRLPAHHAPAGPHGETSGVAAGPEELGERQPFRRPARSVSMATVLFDFDGTLVRGDTFGAFFLWWLRRSPLHLAGVLSLSPYLAPGFGLGPDSVRDAVGSVALWAGTLGVSEARLMRAFGAFTRARFSNARHAISPALDAFARHRRAGDRVLVVTGCESRLARMSLSRLGVTDDTEVVGSELRRFAGGNTTAVHCLGPRKVERLYAANVRTWDLVYSDSHRDLPLMRAAQHTVLVSPSERSLTLCRAALAQRMRVVRW